MVGAMGCCQRGVSLLAFLYIHCIVLISIAFISIIEYWLLSIEGSDADGWLGGLDLTVSTVHPCCSSPRPPSGSLVLSPIYGCYVTAQSHSRLNLSRLLYRLLYIFDSTCLWHHRPGPGKGKVLVLHWNEAAHSIRTHSYLALGQAAS